MTLWAIITVIAMLVVSLIAFLPLVPGPIGVWGIGLIYAWATGFATVGPWALGMMTGLMLIGATADYWTPYFGLQAEGNLSTRSFVASTIGAILGTFFIPVPVAGTFIGAGAAVMLLVWHRHHDWNRARRAGIGIFKAAIASFLVEFAMSIGIIMVFVYALFPWRQVLG